MSAQATHYDVDIAIAGSGLVGASAALALAQALPNLNIALFDTIDFDHVAPDAQAGHTATLDARASALSYETVRDFETLGIWPSLKQYATPMHTVEVSAQGKWGQTTLKKEQANLPMLGVVVENKYIAASLFAALRRHANIQLLGAHAIEGVTQDEEGSVFEGTICSQGTHQDDPTAFSGNTKLFIICDGAQSSLKAKLGIGNTLHDFNQTAYIFNIRTEHAHQNIAFERFTDQGPMAVLPLHHHMSAVVMTVDNDTAIDITDTKGLATRVEDKFGQRLGRILETGDVSTFPLIQTISQEFVRPHTVVLGNAAHTLHPVAGQGYNLCLRDIRDLAATLKKQLKANIPLGRLRELVDYQTRREYDLSVTATFTNQLTAQFNRPSLTTSVINSLGLTGLTVLPGVKSMFNRIAMGYR